MFPPIFPLLSFLKEQKVVCTIVVPELYPVPIWWPKLRDASVGSFCIDKTGQLGAVKIPSKRGFISDRVGHRWPMFAFRVSFC